MSIAKVYKLGTEPSFAVTFEVVDRKVLNFTDISGNNNKFYVAELQYDSRDSAQRIYTTYGRVGATNPAREYRIYQTLSEAQKDFAALIKSKTKKGYVEVQLVRSDVGSEIGKAKIEANKVSIESLEKVGIKLENIAAQSSKLHPEVQKLVSSWFGSTAQFVEANLDSKKCPLGQLSLDAITKGKDILQQARDIVHRTRPDTNELNRLTSLYYSNIPHVLPHRIDANLLRFDSDSKIDRAHDILDVFQDAKNVEKVLKVSSGIDNQYAALNAEIEFVERDSMIFKWIEKMVHDTRASNHGNLGKIKVHRVFHLLRNGEDKHFLERAEAIAKECGSQVIPEVLGRLVPERPDTGKETTALYKKANVLPLWHGTRRANMIGITQKGLLIRPSGVPHAGSMFGDGIYWATNSTKSINYTDARGSVWAGGTAQTAFLFLADVACGNQKIVSSSGWHTLSSIRPNHSVWAKKGPSLYNDELITYAAAGRNQQHVMRYVIEFETKA